MNLKLKEYKRTLRDFMQKQYTDEKLVALLDHARSGKLSFVSCCCFIGVVTADHLDESLKGETSMVVVPHYMNAQLLPGALEAEEAYAKLWVREWTVGNDEIRRTRLIPMILAEIRRRQKEKQNVIHAEHADAHCLCSSR